MLEFIVQEHDSSFKALVPAIIEFNLHQTLPVLEKVCLIRISIGGRGKLLVHIAYITASILFHFL